MAQLLSDRRDIDFVLYEQLKIEDILRAEKFKDLNRKMLDMVITEARNLGIKEIYPTYKEGDREGVKFENGKVMAPSVFSAPTTFSWKANGLPWPKILKWAARGFPRSSVRRPSSIFPGQITHLPPPATSDAAPPK